MTPLTIVIVSALVAAAVIPMALSLLRVPYTAADIAIVAIGHAPFAFVPTIGGPLSLLAMIALLRWRAPDASLFDLGVTVSAARLLAVPVLMALR